MLDFLKNGKGELLSFFFRDVNKEYYLSEIAKNLNKEASFYQRYLDKFVKDGILLNERKGNMRFFRLNQNHPLFNEIRSIISKTLGIEGKFKSLVDSLPGVVCSFIFGSIASNKENCNSDIDLVLIGSVDQNYLIEKISILERELSREINYHIYEQQEIINKLKEKNSFLINIFTKPLIILKGNLNEFTKYLTK